MRMPPTAGPSAAPVAPALAQTTVARRSEPTVAGSSSSAAVTAAAPPSACTQRAAISVDRWSERPQARPAPAKTASPTAAVRPGPARRARWAAGTAASAITRLNETSTQVTAGDAGVQLAIDLRQRQDDDRRVGEDEADGERQRGEARSRRRGVQ